MKLNLFILGFVALLGLSSCSTPVEETGYVATTPGFIYRGPPYHHRPPYYGSSLYYEGGVPVHSQSRQERYYHRNNYRTVSYRTETRTVR